MNITSIIKLVAALAWAGVAVSSATPANALAMTTQSGDFANCPDGSYDPWSGTLCGYSKNYLQAVKFISTACGSSSCSQGGAATYTDFIYVVGRKVTTRIDSCNTYNVYGLGPCQC
jgi:hypothetical protein